MAPDLRTFYDPPKFQKAWQAASADSDVALYGFRRFKTSHLINLRFLEDEIAELDHVIYQTGLALGLDHCPANRLGLKYCRRDAPVSGRVRDTIPTEAILRLRHLLREYDEALLAFHQIMTMERCSLLDDEQAASARKDLTLPEMYETRLLRPDLPPRSRSDPVSRWLHKLLRDLRYWRLSTRQGCDKDKARGVEEQGGKAAGRGFSHQNSAPIANAVGRILITVVSSLFLVVPPVVLSPKSLSGAQITAVTACIAVFSFLVAVMTKASNFEMMAVSSAYAAVLTVFISNGSD